MINASPYLVLKLVINILVCYKEYFCILMSMYCLTNLKLQELTAAPQYFKLPYLTLKTQAAKHDCIELIVQKVINKNVLFRSKFI